MNDSEIIELMSNIKHRIFPRAFERLAFAGKGKDLVGVEIGVWKGEHALSLLGRLPIKTLYLIDKYEDYGEENQDYGQSNLKLCEIIADCNLRDFGNKVIKIKKYSSECLENIPANLDFVYIDGNHNYNFVKEDINNYYPKIKEGGVIGGHDFYNGFTKEHNGVIQAVTEFTVKNNLQLNVELPDWWAEIKTNG